MLARLIVRLERMAPSCRLALLVARFVRGARLAMPVAWTRLPDRDDQDIRCNCLPMPCRASRMSTWAIIRWGRSELG
jgi:hypothetical protein